MAAVAVGSTAKIQPILVPEKQHSPSGQAKRSDQSTVVTWGPHLFSQVAQITQIESDGFYDGHGRNNGNQDDLVQDWKSGILGKEKSSDCGNRRVSSFNIIIICLRSKTTRSIPLLPASQQSQWTIMERRKHWSRAAFAEGGCSNSHCLESRWGKCLRPSFTIIREEINIFMLQVAVS